MRPVVARRWLEFTEPLEGGIDHLYADVRGLITIAFGNLVDPLSAALTLPLLTSNGAPATQAEITAEWLRVKGDPRAAARGHLYARQLTTLRLSHDSMADIALAKLETNDAVLRGRLPDWESYPACAQMALHSLSWACGPAFHFPKLISAVQARDWDAASVHIQIREITPEGIVNAGLRARNAANRRLMANAARVEAYKLDPDTLDWNALIGVADIETLPDVSELYSDDEDDDYFHQPTTLTESVAPDNVASLPTRYPKPEPDPAA